MWYVMWVITGSEQEMLYKIEDNVDHDVCLSAWSPCRIERRKVKGEDRDVRVRLFPGYLIVDTDDPNEIHEVLKKEPEYIGILKAGDDYVPVSEAEQAIIGRLTGFEGTAGMSIGVIDGGRLKVIEGNLKGMERYIVHIDRHKKKARLEIELFGEVRRFTMGLEIVDKK